MIRQRSIAVRSCWVQVGNIQTGCGGPSDDIDAGSGVGHLRSTFKRRVVSVAAPATVRVVIPSWEQPALPRTAPGTSASSGPLSVEQGPLHRDAAVIPPIAASTP